MSSVHPQRCQGFDQTFLHKDHGAECKLVLAASRKSEQAQSRREEALVESSGFMGSGPGRLAKHVGHLMGRVKWPI